MYYCTNFLSPDCWPCWPLFVSWLWFTTIITTVAVVCQQIVVFMMNKGQWSQRSIHRKRYRADIMDHGQVRWSKKSAQRQHGATAIHMLLYYYGVGMHCSPYLLCCRKFGQWSSHTAKHRRNIYKQDRYKSFFNKFMREKNVLRFKQNWNGTWREWGYSRVWRTM